MDNYNEKEILSKIKKGDTKAFEKILFKYEKAIFGYIFKMTSHRQTAEDLTQETFIKVYKKRKTIDLEKSFKSWLYKIATNTVYDWLRSVRGGKELLIINDDNNPFETIDEDSTYLKVESNYDLEKALSKIKPIYKAVIILFYYEGLSYEQIASTLSLPLNTVKTHLRRAKEDLKKELNK